MSDNNGWPGKPWVPMNPERWRGAINDALTNWLSPIEDHETPADALQRLIRMEVDAALDPAVSWPAADLVATARRDALEEAEQDLEGRAKMLRTFDPDSVGAHWAMHYAAAIRALKGEAND